MRFSEKQCRSKVRFIGGVAITSSEGASCLGFRGHAPLEDFEIWGL